MLLAWPLMNKNILSRNDYKTVYEALKNTLKDFFIHMA